MTTADDVINFARTALADRLALQDIHRVCDAAGIPSSEPASGFMTRTLSAVERVRLMRSRLEFDRRMAAGSPATYGPCSWRVAPDNDIDNDNAQVDATVDADCQGEDR